MYPYGPQQWWNVALILKYRSRLISDFAMFCIKTIKGCIIPHLPEVAMSLVKFCSRPEVMSREAYSFGLRTVSGLRGIIVLTKRHNIEVPSLGEGFLKKIRRTHQSGRKTE